MRRWLDDDFMLQSNAAKTLYHDYAEQLPIVDYHNHLNPSEIVYDKKYKSITQAWLEFDHYKWRVMRLAGIEEKFITGDAGDFEKFERFAKVLPKLIGSPMYHWIHLELKRFFDISEPLNGENAKAIYEKCNDKFDEITPQSVLKQQNVKLFCTTDDPCDDLTMHKKAKETCNFIMLPTFRAENILNIEDDNFGEYLKKFEDSTGFKIKTINTFKTAIIKRLDYFESIGCKISDQSFSDIVVEPGGNIEKIFDLAKSGLQLSPEQVRQYQTEMLMFLGKEYKKRKFVMQYRFGVVRNSSSLLYSIIGKDAGGDAISGSFGHNGRKLAKLLDLLQNNDALPDTILYSLNPNDNAVISSVLGCFSNAQTRVTQGSGWWFNDTKFGMESQLQNFAEGCILGDFVGMVTDSRSVFSFVRHEYFRRILCNFIGGLISKGEYPEDMDLAGRIIEDICYNNVIKILNLNKEKDYGRKEAL